jgi:lipoyl-dependent peroxiredoxin
LADKIGCIQMYISIVYIDTYAIRALMLLSPYIQESLKFEHHLEITLERNKSTMEKYRKAGVLWTGDLKNGHGILSTESRALFEQPLNSRMRFDDEAGTNPEELIAAAHAACFSMALASTLAKHGFEPVRTDTTATCILASKDGGGFEITTMQIHIRAEVPGVDENNFEKLVRETNEVCPVSNLLRSGLDIQIDATLLRDNTLQEESSKL